MRTLGMVAACVFIALALGYAYDATAGKPRGGIGQAVQYIQVGDGSLIAAVHRARVRTWRCQRAIGRHHTPTSYMAERSPSIAFRKWALELWERRAAFHCNISRQVGNVSHWLCIYRREKGADGWATNTGNGYYGGLQMDLQFQRTYGADLLRAKGTADRWTPFEQMMVAERARRSGRGYYPWPNTARRCGLL